MRWKLGRPGAAPDKMELARRELAKGIGIGNVREVGLAVVTVHRLKRQGNACRRLMRSAGPRPKEGHDCVAALISPKFPRNFGLAPRSRVGRTGAFARAEGRHRTITTM